MNLRNFISISNRFTNFKIVKDKISSLRHAIAWSVFSIVFINAWAVPTMANNWINKNEHFIEEKKLTKFESGISWEKLELQEDEKISDKDNDASKIEKTHTLADISKKSWDNTYVFNSDVWDIDINTVEIWDFNFVEIRNWKQVQYLYREDPDSIFILLDWKDENIESIKWWSKIVLYTNEEFTYKSYLPPRKQYDSLQSELRFELYGKDNWNEDWFLEFNFPNRVIEQVAKIDEIIPSSVFYVILRDKNWDEEIIVRDRQTWKFNFENKNLAKIKRPIVLNWYSVKVLSLLDYYKLKQAEHKVLQFNFAYSKVLSDNYDRVNKKYKKSGKCWFNVRWALKSLLDLDVPDYWMDWYRYIAELDKLVEKGLLYKKYIWRPENAEPWAILAYQRYFWEKDTDRYKWWHVEIVLPKWYFHWPIQWSHWWSLTWPNDNTWFTWFAYYHPIRYTLKRENVWDVDEVYVDYSDVFLWETPDISLASIQTITDWNVLQFLTEKIKTSELDKEKLEDVVSIIASKDNIDPVVLQNLTIKLNGNTDILFDTIASQLDKTTYTLGLPFDQIDSYKLESYTKNLRILRLILSKIRENNLWEKV